MATFIAKTTAPFNGTFTGNMDDQWATLLTDFISWAERWHMRCDINTHADGTGDGITIYGTESSWQPDQFAEYVALLGRIPSWPDGELDFSTYASNPEVPVFGMWHD